MPYPIARALFAYFQQQIPRGYCRLSGTFSKAQKDKCEISDKLLKIWEYIAQTHGYPPKRQSQDVFTYITELWGFMSQRILFTEDSNETAVEKMYGKNFVVCEELDSKKIDQCVFTEDFKLADALLTSYYNILKYEKGMKAFGLFPRELYNTICKDKNRNASYVLAFIWSWVAYTLKKPHIAVRRENQNVCAYVKYVWSNLSISTFDVPTDQIDAVLHKISREVQSRGTFTELGIIERAVRQSSLFLDLLIPALGSQKKMFSELPVPLRKYILDGVETCDLDRVVVITDEKLTFQGCIHVNSRVVSVASSFGGHDHWICLENGSLLRYKTTTGAITTILNYGCVRVVGCSEGVLSLCGTSGKLINFCAADHGIREVLVAQDVLDVWLSQTNHVCYLTSDSKVHTFNSQQKQQPSIAFPPPSLDDFVRKSLLSLSSDSNRNHFLELIKHCRFVIIYQKVEEEHKKTVIFAQFNAEESEIEYPSNSDMYEFSLGGGITRADVLNRYLVDSTYNISKYTIYDKQNRNANCTKLDVQVRLVKFSRNGSHLIGVKDLPENARSKMIDIPSSVLEKQTPSTKEQIRYWNIPISSQITCYTFSHVGTITAFGTSEGELFIRTTENAEWHKFLCHGDITSVAFSPCDQFLTSVCVYDYDMDYKGVDYQGVYIVSVWKICNDEISLVDVVTPMYPHSFYGDWIKYGGLIDMMDEKYDNISYVYFNTRQQFSQLQTPIGWVDFQCTQEVRTRLKQTVLVSSSGKWHKYRQLRPDRTEMTKPNYVYYQADTERIVEIEPKGCDFRDDVYDSDFPNCWVGPMSLDLNTSRQMKYSEKDPFGLQSNNQMYVSVVSTEDADVWNEVSSETTPNMMYKIGNPKFTACVCSTTVFWVSLLCVEDTFFDVAVYKRDLQKKTFPQKPPIFETKCIKDIQLLQNRCRAYIIIYDSRYVRFLDLQTGRVCVESDFQESYTPEGYKFEGIRVIDEP